MPSEGINYSAVLADLEAKRAAIDSAIGAIRQVLNLGAEESVAPSPAASAQELPSEVRFDSFFGMSTPDAVRKFLSMMKRPQLASEIGKALKDGGLPTTSANIAGIVGPTLTRMKAAGDLVPIQGRWALSEWYPAGARERLEAMEKGKTKKGKKQGKKPITKKTGGGPSEPPHGAEPKKPSEEQIAQIRALHAAGKRPGEIAKQTGVQIFTVTRIIKGLQKSETATSASDNNQAQV